MSLRFELLKVIIHDDCLEVVTSKGSGRYVGCFLTTHNGEGENLPGALIVTDARTIKPAVNVTAESVLWGADVKWQWPKEADESWYASVRASWTNGEVVKQQGKRISYPETAYTITGVPAGVDITASITLHNGNGRRSQPAEVSTKSSDDAAKILDDVGMFTIKDGQVFIKDAAGITRAKVCGFDEHDPFTLADCKKRFGDSEPIPFGGFPMPKRKVRINIAGLQQWKNGIVSGAEVRVDIIQNGKCIHSEVFSGKATQPFTREIEISASFDDIVAVHNRPDLPNLKVTADFVSEKHPFFLNNGQAFINGGLLSGTKTYTLNTCIKVNSDKADTSADKIREIVSRYLTGEATQYEDELVGELKSFIEKESAYTRLATLISEQVRQRIKAESHPGGLLHKR